MEFILSPPEQRQGLRFEVSSERLSPEIDILLWSLIPVRGRCCLTQILKLVKPVDCSSLLITTNNLLYVILKNGKIGLSIMVIVVSVIAFMIMTK